ncbi:hypothetical protein Lser_V15G19628 [Lactuca serriola]
MVLKLFVVTLVVLFIVTINHVYGRKLVGEKTISGYGDGVVSDAIRREGPGGSNLAAMSGDDVRGGNIYYTKKPLNGVSLEGPLVWPEGISSQISTKIPKGNVGSVKQGKAKKVKTDNVDLKNIRNAYINDSHNRNTRDRQNDEYNRNTENNSPNNNNNNNNNDDNNNGNNNNNNNNDDNNNSNNNNNNNNNDGDNNSSNSNNNNNNNNDDDDDNNNNNNNNNNNDDGNNSANNNNNNNNNNGGGNNNNNNNNNNNGDNNEKSR